MQSEPNDQAAAPELPPGFSTPPIRPDDVLDPSKLRILDESGTSSSTPIFGDQESSSGGRSTPSSSRTSRLRELLGGDRDSSSTGSTDNWSQETADAVKSIVREIAAVLGSFANHRSRKGSAERWLLTEKEANDLGASFGNIAGRRVPANVTGGADAADLFVIGATSLGYTLRNAADADERVTQRDTAAGDPGDPPTASYVDDGEFPS
jgi:hypothetical protein